MFEYNVFETHLKSTQIGHKLKYFETISSTNDEAKKYLNKHNQHGYVIITKNQTNGRGRRDNKWFSVPNKSLTFSIIINQNKIKNNQLLSIIPAVAITKAIKQNSNLQCNIKWPNDIMLNNKKIGGILIETKFDYAVIGIGLNVNENYNDLNINIENNSSSLRINKLPVIKLEILLANILNVLEECCNQKNENLINEWLNFCSHINKKIKFHENNHIVSGIFKGINQNGQAIININNQTELISSGIIEV